MPYITMNNGCDVVVNPNDQCNQFTIGGFTKLSERCVAHKDISRITLSGTTYQRVLGMCPNIPRLNQGSVRYRGDTAAFILDNWNRIMKWPEWDGGYDSFD